MTIELRPARSLSLSERAGLFAAAYENYVVPMSIDADALAWMQESFDLDLDASRIAFRDGEPVGLVNLAVRGEDAWIGGVGVVASARRAGLGEMLMHAAHEEARRRGVRRIWLEVIDTNVGAVALYEKLGYAHVRVLEVWTLPAAEGGDTAREVPAAEAKARIESRREPWQRADGTIAHYDDVRGLVAEDGAALFCVRSTAQLLQYSGDPVPLLRALRALGDVYVLNLPAGDPAAAALRTLGGAVTVRQHEMLLS